MLYDDYHEQALLGFVEDALMEEEDGSDEPLVVTKEGREMMLMALKTVIDVMTTRA